MNDTEILATYGSPSYVYDLASVRNAYTMLRAALPEPSHIYYSLKANPHPLIVSQLIEQGCGCEICSTGELQTALGCEGIHLEDVLYTGPGKTQQEIRSAMKHGVVHFSVDSLYDITKVVEVAATFRVQANLILRINPDRPITGSGLTMTGTPSQFGIDSSVILQNPLAYRSCQYGRVIGYHIYIGTNITSTEQLYQTFLAAIQQAAELSCAQNIELGLLDLGGGFGHEFAKPGETTDFRALKPALHAALDRYFPDWRSGKPRIAFEAGRYLTAASGTLLCRVEDVKQSKNQPFVILDTGIHHLGGMSGLNRVPRIGLAFAEQEKQPEGEMLQHANIVGPLCTPLDYLARCVDIPQVKPGDVLRIPNVGAYGLTASLLAFLSRDTPIEIILDNDTVCHVSRIQLKRKEGIPMLNEQFENLLRHHLKYLPAGKPLAENQRLKDYGLDSMEAINLLLDIEDTYGVVMPDKYLTDETFSTAQALWAVIEHLQIQVNH